MTVPMDIRSLAVACAKAARRIEEHRKLIAANEASLKARGYPDLMAVLLEIEREEAEKWAAMGKTP